MLVFIIQLLVALKKERFFKGNDFTTYALMTWVITKKLLKSMKFQMYKRPYLLLKTQVEQSKQLQAKQKNETLYFDRQCPWPKVQ